MKREAPELGGESISSDQKQYDRMKREKQMIAKSAEISAYDSSMLDISSEEESELSDVNIYSLYDKRYFSAESSSAIQLELTMIRSGMTGQAQMSRDESQVLSKMPLHVKAGDGDMELGDREL